ncbi:NAD(P)/FAD-dependent oxidoreductase [Micromonospora radicis]|uniref:NAD(P)/FAD-dependent oxidoreductase n=1 Tax=Micromonospora radicis TaxID=1894971 RepID=A0A418MUM7_9ACTN|nr:FAD/NAD(P)-binding oxidoreductase [Micromonospora radicis]RIV37961.1 NAD(P)/FAD-dependent oxidoreductase [Micromonospora radicis]
MTGDLIVVGASVATTAFIERMRELGSGESITVLDNDPDAPYDRPPLSKHYLVDGDSEDIAVDWNGLDVELVRAEAVGVNPETHTLQVRGDDHRDHDLRYGRLVIATGATPVHLPIEPPGLAVLRTAADARRIRAQASGRRSVAIVGAGAVGVELASHLARQGSPVVLIDRAVGPLERLLAGHLADEVTDWLHGAGVVCRWRADITDISQIGDSWRVELADGERIEADVVVSAVGARPAVAWLAGSGLLTGDALLADADGRVVTADSVVADVYAMGDVVTRRRPDGRLERTENWAAARQQGMRLAEHICRAPRQPVPSPYFWIQVANRTIQIVGTLRPGARLDLEAANPDRRSALYRVRADGATAWIGVNAQPRIAKIISGS